MNNKIAKQKYWIKKRKDAPMTKCACGCGRLLKSIDKYGRPVGFISGHNNRKYEGKDATNWAREKRWRVSRPEKIRDAKKAFYRRRKLIAMNMLGNKCEDCGLKYDGKNASVFEFHHRNPHEKERGVTRMLINRALADTVKEIGKCALLCSNCHRRTHGGGDW